MFEVVVEVKAVSVLHVFPSGIFIKNASFPTCQGLQCAFQLTLLYGNNGGKKPHWTLKQKMNTTYMISRMYTLQLRESKGRDLCKHATILLIEY